MQTGGSGGSTISTTGGAAGGTEGVYRGVRAWRQARVRAAVLIQSHFRGFLTRRSLAEGERVRAVSSQVAAGRAVRCLRAWAAVARMRGRRARR